MSAEHQNTFQALEECARNAEAASEALARVKDGLQLLKQERLKEVFNPPLSPKRKRIRLGKIETGPELHTFIRERINHMTFAQIAKAVSERFPTERHVSISSIHRWWHRQNRDA